MTEDILNRIEELEKKVGIVHPWPTCSICQCRVKRSNHWHNESFELTDTVLDG